MDTISYTREEVSAEATETLAEIPIAENLGFDLTSFEDGLYRIFWELNDGTIQWKNIYKSNSSQIDEAEMALDALCQ